MKRRLTGLRLTNHDTSCACYCGSPVWKSFSWRNRAAATAWFLEARPWLHPGRENLLEVDEEANRSALTFLDFEAI